MHKLDLDSTISSVVGLKLRAILEERKLEQLDEVKIGPCFKHKGSKLLK